MPMMRSLKEINRDIIAAKNQLRVRRINTATRRINHPFVEVERIGLGSLQRANRGIAVDSDNKRTVGEGHDYGYIFLMKARSVADKSVFKAADWPSVLQLKGTGYIMMEVVSSVVPSISFAG